MAAVTLSSSFDFFPDVNYFRHDISRVALCVTVRDAIKLQRGKGPKQVHDHLVRLMAARVGLKTIESVKPSCEEPCN